MASPLPFDVLKLIRLAPLLTSTASLTFAHDHDLFFRAFLHPSYTTKANAFIPPWTAIYMPRGGFTIMTLYPSTLLLAIANVYVGNTPAASFYYAGLAFTIGHFLFAGRAIGLLNRMKRDESKGKSTDDMAAWVNMNVLRTLAVDLPGWVCYLLAAMGSLQI